MSQPDLHGDCLAVTGRTVAENLAELDPPDLDGKILHTLADPIHPTGGITILRGSPAPDAAVVKSARYAACWPNTPGWSAPPPKVPSADD